MLILNPRIVTFDGRDWTDVSMVTVDREATRRVESWSDAGPHLVLADAPEQRVTVRVVQAMARDDLDGPKPGDEGPLSFHTAPTGGDVPRRRVSAQVVIRGITHELSVKAGAIRTIEMTAISDDGMTDPIVVEDAT